MKYLIVVIVFIMLASCTKELPVVGEVPVTNDCMADVISKIEEWNKNYEGTRIELMGEYIEFTKFSHSVSPMTGYIRLRAGNLDGKPDIYLNTLAGLCHYSETSIIPRNDLGYRVLKENIARSIETGTKELFIQAESNEIRISKRRSN